MCAPGFWLTWPEDIKEEYQSGKITNYDLNIAGLLLMWIVIETVLPSLKASYVAMFIENSPMVGWVKRLSARGSHVAIQLLHAFSFCIRAKGISLLTKLHIPGYENKMEDIPSQSFSSNADWFCCNYTNLLTLFNKNSLSQTRPLGPYSALQTKRV